MLNFVMLLRHLEELHATSTHLLVFYSSSANKRTKELVCGRLQAGGVGVLSKAGILRHFGKLPGLKSTRVALQFSGNQRAYY
jgi:hypothetical protein